MLAFLVIRLCGVSPFSLRHGEEQQELQQGLSPNESSSTTPSTPLSPSPSVSLHWDGAQVRALYAKWFVAPLRYHRWMWCSKADTGR
nr:unnamed protein product [Digitaria exilis]